MRVALQPAYILHSRAYRDSSALLEVFTAEHGRISLVARGARRKGRGGTPGARLQPFTPLLLSFSGRSELKALGASETVGRPRVLHAQRLFSGLYLNELLVRLLHRHDPHPRLFACYDATLDALAGIEPVDDVLRQFEFNLLGELGYGFSLDLDGLSGEALCPECWYYYHPDWGLVRDDAARGPSPRAFCGADLLAMATGGFGGPARATAKRLLRLVLSMHLGDRPLHSRELFRSGGAAERGAAGPERAG